ncbi:dephospho-CoA kinase [Ruminococcaceae bacterium OttesenSCG-928-D13]|nr:dephospho-CoA kinase [Ruminococcaceae bacterium OttesenSCG-928-D13]
MLMVGITGRSGSGKSSVSGHYAALGYTVADGDLISRQVTGPASPCLAELVEAFGSAILQADGTLNRRALGELAFKSPENNRKLVEITHPHILAEMRRRAEAARAAGERLFFVDGAMIVGGPVQPMCDKIVLVVSEARLSISRIILRDNISKIAAQQRLSAQLPEAELRQAADYIIENNGSLEQLGQQAEAVLAELLALTKPPDGEGVAQ